MPNVSTRYFLTILIVGRDFIEFVVFNIHVFIEYISLQSKITAQNNSDDFEMICAYVRDCEAL